MSQFFGHFELTMEPTSNNNALLTFILAFKMYVLADLTIGKLYLLNVVGTTILVGLLDARRLQSIMHDHDPP